MAWATINGMVGILHEEMTGSAHKVQLTANVDMPILLTGIVTGNCCLHDCLHPFPDDTLVVGAEEVHLVLFVFDSESILARVDILVHCHSITNDIDVSLDFGLLDGSSARFTIK